MKKCFLKNVSKKMFSRYFLIISFNFKITNFIVIYALHILYVIYNKRKFIRRTILTLVVNTVRCVKTYYLNIGLCKRM